MNSVSRILIVIALLLPGATYGQLKFGKYQCIPDTANRFLSNWSTLILNADQTFEYEYRTTSCLLWYDSKGKWQRNKDTLFLSEAKKGFTWGVDFRTQETNNKKISFLVKTKQGAPAPGIKILYLFKNTTDTLHGFTDAEGKFVIDTKNIIPDSKNDRSIDDVQIFVEFTTNKHGRGLWNNFSDLSADITCTLDKDPWYGIVNRTTAFRIVNNKLLYLFTRSDKEEATIGQHLYGDYEMSL